METVEKEQRRGKSVYDMRYKGIKGRFWKVFSDFIRLRDFKKYNGQCISCGRTVLYESLQAGHFAPAGNCGFALLFDEVNVNGECSTCNGFDRGHLIGYKNRLIERYGKKKVDELEKKYNDSHFKGITTKCWTKREYEVKIVEYKEKTKTL